MAVPNLPLQEYTRPVRWDVAIPQASILNVRIYMKLAIERFKKKHTLTAMLQDVQSIMKLHGGRVAVCIAVDQRQNSTHLDFILSVALEIDDDHFLKPRCYSIK